MKVTAVQDMHQIW